MVVAGLALITLAERPGQVSTESVGTNLRVTFQVLREDYCTLHAVGDDDVVGHANFRLRVQIYNEGKQPVILSRKCVGVYSPLLMRVKPDGSAGEILYSVSPDDLVVSTDPVSTDWKDYQVVRPGESFEMKDSTTVLFRLPTDQNLPAKLPDSGSYLLGLELNTWNLLSRAPIELRNRWSTRGYLFDGDLVSESIPVKIEPPAKLAACRDH
jgi:hypothetical protein